MSDFWGIMYNCGVMLWVMVVYISRLELQSKQLRKLFLSIYIIYEFFLTMSSFFGTIYNNFWNSSNGIYDNLSSFGMACGGSVVGSAVSNAYPIGVSL